MTILILPQLLTVEMHTFEISMLCVETCFHIWQRVADTELPVSFFLTLTTICKLYQNVSYDGNLSPLILQISQT